MRYEWKCKQCGAVREVYRKVEDYQVPPYDECECEAEDWERIISETSTPFEHLRDKGVLERTNW